jgi:tetratricopeptide (TPR) repeat protein
VPATGTFPDPKLSGLFSNVRFYQVFAGALLISLLAFSSAITGDIILDDNRLPFADPRAQKMPAAFWIGGVRPLLMASYWLNFKLSGLNTLSYHALNIFLHALTASFVWLCARKLLEMAQVDPGRRPVLAGLIAGIFLLHPLQTESVDYIAGRSEVLAGLFFFAAFALFLCTPPDRFGFWRVSAIIALILGAFLSKENGVVVVALILFTDIFWHEGNVTKQLRGAAKLYYALLVVGTLGVGFVLRVLLSARTAGFQVQGLRWYEYFFTQWRVIWQYLSLFILPVGQSGDWMFRRSHGVMDNNALLYGIGLLLTIVVAIRIRKWAPLAAYGFLVFLLLLAPTSSVLPIQDVMAERRMYVPMFGLALLTAGLFDKAKVKPGSIAISAVLILTVAGAITWERSKVWRSALDFWTDVLKNSPANARAYVDLGNAQLRNGRCNEAVRNYETVKATQAMRGTQAGFKLDVNLATAYDCANQPDKALRTIRQIGIRSDSPPEMLTQLGMLATKLGDNGTALNWLNESIRLDPGNSQAWALRGFAELPASPADAERDFRQAATLNPANDLARAGLARLRSGN